jgi:hypothetical protein
MSVTLSRDDAIDVRRFRPLRRSTSWAIGAKRMWMTRKTVFFANNPLLDDLLEWRQSPEGQQFAELADALCDLMEDVQLDAK